MEFLDIVPCIVEEVSANVTIPQRKGETARAAILISEIEAVVIVALIRHAIEIIEAIVVELAIYGKAAGVVVGHVERDADAVNVTQIDQRLELRGS